MAFIDKEKTSIKDLIEAKGTEGANEVIQTALEEKKLDASDFSIAELWEQCQKADGQSVNLTEALTGNSFPLLTGTLISNTIIKGYDLAATVGDMLVDTVKSTQQRDTIAGLTGLENPMEVGEGMEYSDSTITEKYVTVDHMKFGRLMSLTEEMIYFDRTGQVLKAAKKIGKTAALYKERLILRGVQDLDGNVYNPSGNATDLYSTTNQNLITSAPFGEDGLTTMRTTAQTITGDGIDGNFISIDMNNIVLLMPAHLEVAAAELSNSILTPESAENAVNFWKNKFNVISSPFVTDESASTWYGGNPKEQFSWSEIWPLQTFTQKAGHEDSFKRDIKVRFKTRFYGNIMATDTLYFWKMTA